MRHFSLLSFLVVSLVSSLGAAQSASRVPAALASSSQAADTADPPAYVEPAKEKRGFVLDVGSSIVVPSGSWVRGVSASDFGPGEGISLLLGVYVSPHVGLLIGGEGSFDHRGTSGCSGGKTYDGKACGGVTFGLPAIVELAVTDRKRGLYFQLGVKALSTFVVYGTGGSVLATSPADGRLGIGYRWAAESFRQHTESPSWGSMDLYAAVEAGRFNRIGDTSSSVDVPTGAQDVHHSLDVGLKVHFTP